MLKNLERIRFPSSLELCVCVLRSIFKVQPVLKLTLALTFHWGLSGLPSTCTYFVNQEEMCRELSWHFDGSLISSIPLSHSWFIPLGLQPGRTVDFLPFVSLSNLFLLLTMTLGMGFALCSKSSKPSLAALPWQNHHSSQLS